MVWERLHVAPFFDGSWDGQRECVYLVRTKRFEPNPALSPEELVKEYVHEVGWWTKDEIAQSEGVFSPRAFKDLLATILSEGPPEKPFKVGM